MFVFIFSLLTIRPVVVKQKQIRKRVQRSEARAEKKRSRRTIETPPPASPPVAELVTEEVFEDMPCGVCGKVEDDPDDPGIVCDGCQKGLLVLHFVTL